MPQIDLNLDDAGGTLGLRGTIGGWSWDLSDTPGYIDARRPNATVPTPPLPGTVALDLLTTAQSPDKIVGSARLTLGPAAFGANVVRFGRFKAIQVVQEQVYAPVTTVDLTADLNVARSFSLGLGVLNVGNAYRGNISPARPSASDARTRFAVSRLPGAATSPTAPQQATAGDGGRDGDGFALTVSFPDSSG